MKVLLTLDFPPSVGGIQRYLADIVRFTYSNNDCVLAQGKKKSSSSLHNNHAMVYYYATFLDSINKKFALMRFLVPFMKLCFKHQRDLDVECGNIYAALVPWVMKFFTRQSYSIYTYGTELLALHRMTPWTWLLRRALSGATRLMTLSQYSHSLLVKLNIKQPIIVVPPKIVLHHNEYPLRLRRKHPIRVLTIGRLTEHKGHLYLVRAAARLCRIGYYQFIIIGNGPQYEILKDACRHYQIEQFMTIKTNCSDELVKEAYENADFFVLYSTESSNGTEGFGIVLLEAMSYAIPVIASASGGISEVLGGGKYGVLVPPQQPDMLAAAIESLAADPEKADQLARSAFQRVKEFYAWN